MTLGRDTQFGHYKIISQLGSGGMGEVYLALDSRLPRKVAIKCLSDRFGRDPEKLSRFIQEAKATSVLNHPNIVTIHEIGQFDETHFIATEYIEGTTLRDRLENDSLTTDETISISIQIAKALSAAHRVGIIHRDIKPENIMVREDGYVKILDFGLAKLTELGLFQTEDDFLEKEEFKTEPGLVVGTSSYMSPEQANSEVVDARSDIFSFGIVLFEMLTLKLPFEGDTGIQRLISIVYDEPLALADFVSNIPKRLRTISRKTLQKSPSKRYQSSEELLAELRKLSEELKTGDRNQVKKIELKDNSTERTNEPVPVLDENELMVTDFINLTGDEIFDKTLKTALGITLAQSPAIAVLNETRVRKALRLMGQSPDNPVDRKVGRQICLREGLKALITGTIASLGTVYVLTLEAVNAKTGDTFAQQLEQAVSKEDVLSALGKAATGIREKLGESLSSIEKFDIPLEKVTTTSLEALRAFTHGRRKQISRKETEAISFYKKAIEIDPEFASAYAKLAVIYANARELKLAAENASKAFELRDRVSEIEKIRVTYYYYSIATGEIDESIETLKLQKKMYPKEESTYINLCHQFAVSGQFESALTEAEEIVRRNPHSTVGIENMIGTLMCLSRFSKAEKVFHKAKQEKLITEISADSTTLFELYFVRGNADKVQECFDSKRGRPDEYFALHWQAEVAAFQGRIRDTSSFSRRSIEFAKSNNAPGLASRYSAQHALRTAIWHFPEFDSVGFKSDLATQIVECFALETNRFTLTRAAIALAFAGERNEAYQIVDELKADFPKDTLTNQLWLPCIKASLYLHDRRPDKAIKELEITKRLENGGEFIPKYIRALSYLQRNELKRAVDEFDKILDNRGEAPLSSIYPLAQLGRSRATRYRIDYEKFFEMWKEADDDMPVLVGARKEFEELD